MEDLTFLILATIAMSLHICLEWLKYIIPISYGYMLCWLMLEMLMYN